MELTKKERRALRREEQLREIVGVARTRRLKALAVWAGAVLLVAGLIYGIYYYLFFLRITALVDLGETFSIEGTKHVPEGTNVEYHTNPPSSGAHYGKAADWGVYDEELQDEQIVHNLEHGGVWISYKPSIQPVVKEKLTNLVKNYRSKVILTPREANDKDIAVVSWGRIFEFDVATDGSFDEHVVKSYITNYKNTGPELVPD
ncbi:hypothetical protein A2926_03275 [Candidatus Giovannonibacteria bacterium RIFCSPLOWO2_01_FULL_44_40]|uniref:DUF3105 domain-containing protein n=1 Tax=Candidatus Giovannonibacteria bacterium RIFCSPHIGHO2_01_FULL_45_23 TaxID=1798325 RepID=A0A1F5VF78_9BACT|nr:MAG: hypothetical protein A2834_01985 [Candidatus Giovannonibacteria bacterium RIFCSPHIGHO2_01_FULL_45_23]OGF75073.1 MAG: hypothetical protein A3C77_04090 [Candidatus Giovannonibacteria bacterium RIFCSPHIGHO2_02_FULL_45_13]OGF80185.1 MAG: hypothetical protein A2926_03275 [Candidatus Giovannonibacteria bacterium RIFCSPLOWO2_01_FULL_44_40]